LIPNDKRHHPLDLDREKAVLNLRADQAQTKQNKAIPDTGIACEFTE
jgi:hypothetical protein